MNKIKKILSNKLEGHISIGNLTIFGDNAMHFGCSLWTKKYGYICWRLPFFCGIADKMLYGDKLYWRPLYLYFSPNATPWASTFMLGKKHSPDDWALARVRRKKFGHNFSTSENSDKLYKINNIL